MLGYMHYWHNHNDVNDGKQRLTECQKCDDDDALHCVEADETQRRRPVQGGKAHVKGFGNRVVWAYSMLAIPAREMQENAFLFVRLQDREEIVVRKTATDRLSP